MLPTFLLIGLTSCSFLSQKVNVVTTFKKGTFTLSLTSLTLSDPLTTNSLKSNFRLVTIEPEMASWAMVSLEQALEIKGMLNVDFDNTFKRDEVPKEFFVTLDLFYFQSDHLSSYRLIKVVLKPCERPIVLSRLVELVASKGWRGEKEVSLTTLASDDEIPISPFLLYRQPAEKATASFLMKWPENLYLSDPAFFYNLPGNKRMRVGSGWKQVLRIPMLGEIFEYRYDISGEFTFFNSRTSV